MGWLGGGGSSETLSRFLVHEVEPHHYCYSKIQKKMASGLLVCLSAGTGAGRREGLAVDLLR